MAEPDSTPRKRPVTASIRQRIERSGERLWRLDDFRDFPFTAVAQALSRVARNGVIERLSKGVYYRNRQTVLGKSRVIQPHFRSSLPPRRRFSRLESLLPISWDPHTDGKAGGTCHERPQSPTETRRQRCLDSHQET